MCIQNIHTSTNTNTITENNAVWYVIRRCIPIAWVETVSKLYSKVGKWIPKVSWRSWEPTGSNKTAGRHTNEIHKTKNTKIQKSKNIYVKELLYMVKYLYLYFVFEWKYVKEIRSMTKCPNVKLTPWSNSEDQVSQNIFWDVFTKNESNKKKNISEMFSGTNKNNKNIFFYVF